MKLRILSLVLIALIAAAIGRWTAPSSSERPTATTAEAAPAQGQAEAAPRSALSETTPTKPATPAAPPAFIPPESPAPDRRGLGFDPANFLAGLPQQLDQLSDRAQGGDAAALGEVADWLDYCGFSKMAVHASTSSRYNPNTDFDSRRDATVSAYFQQVAATCKTWMARHPWLVAEDKLHREARDVFLARLRAGQPSTPDLTSSGTLAGVLRNRAVENGDLLARARSRRPPPCPTSSPTQNILARQATLREFSACIYQINRDLLARALASRDPRVIAAIPQILNVSSFSLDGYLSADMQYSSSLWGLAACHLGLDCSAANPTLRQACALGLCGYQSLRDYVADQQLTPVRMRMIEVALPRLLALIQAGDVEGILGPPPPP